MGNKPSHPTVDKVNSHEYLTSTGLLVGASGIQGWRDEMEDTHVVIDIPSSPDHNHTLLALFDGHGGISTSMFAKEHILFELENSDAWKGYTSKCFRDKAPSSFRNYVDDLQLALEETFNGLDDKLCRESYSGYLHSGSTACVAIVTPYHFICANAGDSRCVVGSNKTYIALSDDHKPENIIEKTRIVAAGGCVSFGRVDGNLAVSRGLGDGIYKKNTLIDKKSQKITVYPDVKVYLRDNNKDDVLLIACDGLWDVIESGQAIEKVRDLFQLGESSSLLICEELVHGALFEGKSQDNISAILCILPAAVFGPEENGGVAAIRAERDLWGKDKVPRDMYDNIIGMKTPAAQPGSLFYKDDGEDY